MKEQLIRSLLFIGIIFIVYGCGKDDSMGSQGGSGGPFEFTIYTGEIQGLSGGQYIMATSPVTGEVLYWDMMTSFQDSITFQSEDSETVDLTYASEYGSGFNIITYRDVKSKFNFSRFLFPCFDGQNTYDNQVGKSADIIFPGTKEIVEFINPGYDSSELEETGNVMIDDKNKIIYDFDNDITIVNTRLESEIYNSQFTFRFLGGQDYKSIVVKREDWVKEDDENYKLELEVENLLPCAVHDIEVGIDDTWIVNSEVLTTSGDRIKIADWSNYSQNQSGKQIRLFLQDDLEMDQLLVKIEGNNISKGFQFQKHFDNIPTFISLKEYANEVFDLTPTTYNYSTNENFDIIKTSYEYLNGNRISSWDIYQSPSSINDYTLPVIESEFLDETTIMKTSLTNPRDFRIQIYSLETAIDEVYNETGIDRQLQCLDYNSSYDSHDF